jgi:hypothetical protein
VVLVDLVVVVADLLLVNLDQVEQELPVKEILADLQMEIVYTDLAAAEVQGLQVEMVNQEDQVLEEMDHNIHNLLGH